MLTTIVLELHWTPDVIGKMYIDDDDFEGLLYWYDRIKEVNDTIKK